MNLPDLYNRVTAKRPDLCVEEWKWKGADGVSAVPANTAAALILEKWVEALPVGVALVHETTTAWGVDGNGMVYPNRLTPLEALASFYLEYQP